MSRCIWKYGSTELFYADEAGLDVKVSTARGKNSLTIRKH